MNTSQPLTSRIVEVFLHGNLSAMLVVLSLIAGAVALWVTPREEEPQIIVPLADVHISVPGASVGRTLGATPGMRREFVRLQRQIRREFSLLPAALEVLRGRVAPGR